MSGATKFKALPMHVCRYSNLRGSCGTYTLTFTQAPQEKVYRVLQLPCNLEYLQTHIGIALNFVAPDMLKRVWEEMDYTLDVFRVTRGNRIEHLS
ncbi:hypothetical protein AVEN_214884-1 [Araneus ventricosus]|uniref:Uncharacterized protein n=1 Tax=Araneus ventricosus TaxID=182803 RepID=A0A4Y2RQ25_ARAVE|nr:hypothetical protein AVEN_214884-1 [Araneus ventricosus]